jgi:preprotein translocase subunit YajC
MNHVLANLLLAMGPAPTPAGTQADPKAQLFGPMGMLVIMGVMLYFLMFRPEQKRRKQHAELLKSIRAGDKVTTSGGIVGVVVSVKEKTVALRSADTKLEVNKSAIAEITERSSQANES